MNDKNLIIVFFIFTYAEGPFQSDALLVPEGCLFDHIHNASRCWPFVRWNQTGAAACQDRGMQMRSFAMLLPCGISLFSGVEFVCCPKHFKGKRSVFFLNLIHCFFIRSNCLSFFPGCWIRCGMNGRYVSSKKRLTPLSGKKKTQIPFLVWHICWNAIPHIARWRQFMALVKNTITAGFVVSKSVSINVGRALKNASGKKGNVLKYKAKIIH